MWGIYELPYINSRYGPLINYLLSAVDTSIKKLPDISGRALMNYLILVVDIFATDKLPAISNRYGIDELPATFVDMGH